MRNFGMNITYLRGKLGSERRAGWWVPCTPGEIKYPSTDENQSVTAGRKRHYATSRNVRGSRSDEVNEFLQFHLILPAALGPGVYSASNRNENQKQENNVSGE
jgi:hypothetical protein